MHKVYVWDCCTAVPENVAYYIIMLLIIAINFVICCVFLLDCFIIRNLFIIKNNKSIFSRQQVLLMFFE